MRSLGGTSIRIYGEFAELYSKYGYPDFSVRVARLLPKVLARFRSKPTDILDIACGEGTFAVAMAKKGFNVTGVDQSAEMLRFAHHRARRAGAHVRFVRKDMRSLSFSQSFDLVTCWYDSLNYLLRPEDLKKTFSGVWRALRPGGIFVFDMNTARTLSVGWQRHPSFVEVDTEDAFVVHRSSWDARRRVASLRVTGFIRRGERWRRVDELHRERAYTLPKIRDCLQGAGFVELACGGSLRVMKPPRRGTRKYWFVARR